MWCHEKIFPNWTSSSSYDPREVAQEGHCQALCHQSNFENDEIFLVAFLIHEFLKEESYALHAKVAAIVVDLF
jgi:hypothetical protein